MEHNTHFFPLQTQAGKPDNYINVHKGTRSVKSCSIFYFYILTLLFYFLSEFSSNTIGSKVHQF